MDEYFEKDENFSLTDYCNNLFSIYQEEALEITLEFDKSVAEDAANYHFHPTQRGKYNKDGSYTLKFKSGGRYAICQELFKWGTAVKVKKPVELREYYKTYLLDVFEYLE